MKKAIGLFCAWVLATGLVGAAPAVKNAPPPITVPAGWQPKASGWSGLENALNTAQAAAVLGPTCGAPLIVNHSKDGRFETWNYDRGGDLLFVNGELTYWTVPEDQRAAVTAAEARTRLVDRGLKPVTTKRGA